MQRRLRVAVAGAGYFGCFQHDGWARLPEAGLVAICDRDIARARAAAALVGAPACFDDAVTMLDAIAPDLLDIALPPAAHLHLIAAAAARGIATLCQKPFCGGLADARRAAAIAAQTGVPVIVHDNFRFEPWHQEAHRLIHDGTLGQLHGLAFRLRPGDGRGERAYLERQPYFRQMPRFLIHETAIHLIDVFRFLAGEVQAVYADLRRLNPVIAGEDAGIVVFEFDGGARGLFDGNRLLDHAAADRRLTMGELLVEGEAATLRLDGDGRLFLRAVGDNTERELSYAWERRGFAGDSVLRLQRHVAAHLRDGAPVQNDAVSYLANLRVEEAIYESARTQRRVAVSSVP